MWKLITTPPLFSVMPFPKYSWRLLYLSLSISRNLQQKQYKTGPLDHTGSGEELEKEERCATHRVIFRGVVFTYYPDITPINLLINRDTLL